MSTHPHDRQERPPRRTTRVQAPTQQTTIRQPQYPPIKVIQAQHDQLAKDNDQAIQELAAKGIGVDAATLLSARIDHLISCIAQFAGKDGALWEAITQLSWQQKLAAQLEQAEVNSTRLLLSQGSTLTPGQISQLAAASGMFGKSGR